MYSKISVIVKIDNIVVINSQIMRHIARLNDLCEYIYKFLLVGGYY